MGAVSPLVHGYSLLSTRLQETEGVHDPFQPAFCPNINRQISFIFIVNINTLSELQRSLHISEAVLYFPVFLHVNTL